MPLSSTYRPAPRITSLGDAFYDEVTPARFPEARPPLSKPALGRARRPRRRSTPPSGRRTSRASSRSPANLAQPARAPLPRPPVRRVQPAPRRRPRLSLRAARRRRAGACSTSARRGAADAVVARRRRAAHAQGRRARGPRDRDARGARRQHVEVAQPLRDRRGAHARRRAVAHAIVGARAPQSLARPLRHVPAPRALGDAGVARSRSSTYSIAHYFPRCRRRRPIAWRASWPRSRARPPLCGELDGRGLRPRRPQLRQHEHHRRELRLRAVPLPAPRTISTSSRPTSITRGSTPTGASRAPSSGTSRASPTRSAPLAPDAAPLGAGARPSSRRRSSARSRERVVGAPRSRSATATPMRARRRGLRVPRRERRRLRALLLRLVRRRRRARRAPRRRGGRALRGPALGRPSRNPRAVRSRASSALPPYFEGERPCTLLIDEIEAIWSAIAERDDWSRFDAKDRRDPRPRRRLDDVSDRTGIRHPDWTMASHPATMSPGGDGALSRRGDHPLPDDARERPHRHALPEHLAHAVRAIDETPRSLRALRGGARARAPHDDHVVGGGRVAADRRRHRALPGRSTRSISPSTSSSRSAARSCATCRRRSSAPC